MRLFAFILLLSACPPPIVDDLPVDAGVQPLTAEAYCESIVDFFCPFYTRCGRVADNVDCNAFFLETCNARFEPSYVALEREGFLSLSQVGVDACRAHLDDVECDQQLLDLDGPCADMWIGTQPSGAACGFDIETFVCAPGTACVLSLNLCGTCERVLDDGADCAIDGFTCKRDSFCDGVCVARKRAGEACSPDERCVLGAVCTDGVCVGPAYVGVDDACDRDNRCPYATQCIDGACHSEAALKASCDAFTRCSSGFCDDGACATFVDQCTQDDQCQTGICGDDGACATLPSICLQ